MSNIVPKSAVESALIMNDLSKLTTEERLNYYKSVCDSLGLNPLTQPFSFITLNGKLTLYAKRDCTEQLRKIHKVSISISARETIGDVYVVTAKAKDATGKEDESTGAVCITGLKGEALANAFMKCETKAKRRVTLSICGLGLLDETEVETIPECNPQLEKLEAPKEEKKQESNPFVRDAKAEYIIPIGKYKGKNLSEVKEDDLVSYCTWLKNSAKEKGKEITGTYLELITKVNELYPMPNGFDHSEEFPSFK